MDLFELHNITMLNIVLRADLFLLLAAIQFNEVDGGALNSRNGCKPILDRNILLRQALLRMGPEGS